MEVPFEPEGRTSQLSRVVRDDFIAHLNAGGTADTAISELREVYPKRLLDELTYVQVLLTLATIAWETGYLPTTMKRDALQVLAKTAPPEGLTHALWWATTQALQKRLSSPEPVGAALSKPSDATWPTGTVVACDAADAERLLFLVLDRHWVFGRFHALALGLEPNGAPARLLQRNSAAAPCVFVLPECGPQYRSHASLRVPRAERKAALRHMMNMHARLIPPQDVPMVYTSLAY